MNGFEDDRLEPVSRQGDNSPVAKASGQFEDGPTKAGDVTAAVDVVLAEFADSASDVDVRGRLGDQSLSLLARSGVFRLFQPKRWGGFEAEPGHLHDIVRSISRQCSSTGWVASVLAVTPWLLAMFEEQAQQEVWAEKPDALLCASYSPSGRLVPVDGGFELSGHWRSVASSAYASWAVLGGTTFADGDRPVDIVSVLIPMSDYRITGSWDALGLRGSGNNDIHVDNVFVPDHRTLRVHDLALLRGPGQKINSGPLYRLPFSSVFNASFVLPMVGIAEGCLDAYLTEMRDRNRLTLGGTNRPAEDALVAAARASAEIDATVLQLDHSFRDLHDSARRRREITMDQRLRVRRDSAMGAERTIAAIDRIFAVARGSALRRGTHIERAWRDAHTAAAHASNDQFTQLSLCGRGLFGLPVDELLV